MKGQQVGIVCKGKVDGRFVAVGKQVVVGIDKLQVGAVGVGDACVARRRQSLVGLVEAGDALAPRFGPLCCDVVRVAVIYHNHFVAAAGQLHVEQVLQALGKHLVGHVIDGYDECDVGHGAGE